MKEVAKNRSWPVITVALAVLALVAFLIVADTTSTNAAAANAKASKIRWDIVSIAPPVDLSADPGGTASARANDDSKITLTGSGTFVSREEGKRSSAVTGGGTWETFDKDDNSTDGGEYWVTGLVSWHVAPGTLPEIITDNIGARADARAGLAVLAIKYSDGSRGVLVVSCHLPVDSPDSIFEGITVSKGFVDYWNREPPVDNVDANRTVFHVLRHAHEDKEDKD